MDYVKTGQFIQECRKKKKLTQKQLADFLGISDKTVSKWETGKSFPDCDLLPQICQILEVNINELLSGELLSSERYHEKAEVNMVSLMKKQTITRNREILFVVMGVLLGALSLLFMLWVDLAYEWDLVNWFYEPVSLSIEGLFFVAFWLASFGMKKEERFPLARKYIAVVGGVLCLFHLELELLKTEEILRLDPLIVGICLMPVFYALCICILLFFLELVAGKRKKKLQE